MLPSMSGRMRKPTPGGFLPIVKIVFRSSSEKRAHCVGVCWISKYLAPVLWQLLHARFGGGGGGIQVGSSTAEAKSIIGQRESTPFA